jgi:phage tail-like protein
VPSENTALGGEPTTSARFLLEVDGVEIGVFREVTGLQLTVGVEEYQEGGQNGFVHKLPGRMSWPHLVFRRGLTDSDALFTWVAKTSGEGFAANENKLPRCTGAVTVVDSVGGRLRSWEFDGVFPVRWTGPELSADRHDFLEEELEVAHHGFKAKTLT